jgi:hypothetical protein
LYLAGFSNNALGMPVTFLPRRFLKLSKIRDIPVSLSKPSLGDHLIVEIFASIKVPDMDLLV